MISAVASSTSEELTVNVLKTNILAKTQISQRKRYDPQEFLPLCWGWGRIGFALQIFFCPLGLEQIEARPHRPATRDPL